MSTPRLRVLNPDAPLAEKLSRWLGPIFLLSSALYYWAITIAMLPQLPHPKSFQDVRHRAFSRFWLAGGKAMSEEMPGPTADLIGQARGLVLDIGSGSGEQLHRFSIQGDQITELWGVEPATDMHPKLLATAQRLGLKTRFHLLPCGAEPESLVPVLARNGLFRQSQDGLFDDICLIRVLCGLPDPTRTARNLYTMLKPGGRFIVSEHVASPWPHEGVGSVGGFLAQLFWQHVGGWRFLMGGCQLNRDTTHVLLDAAAEDGGWADVDLEWVNPWAAVPFVVGTLTKRECIEPKVVTKAGVKYPSNASR